MPGDNFPILDEPKYNSSLLVEDGNRHVFLPIKHNELYEIMKKQINSFWTPEEIDMEDDISQIKEGKISPGQMNVIKSILSFFAPFDGIIGETIMQSLINEAQTPEAKAWYSTQAFFELAIHSKTYAMQLDVYVPDKDEKDRLLKAATEHDQIAAKKKWCDTHMTPGKYVIGSREHVYDYSRRLLGLAIVELIFFCSSFCIIYWFKMKGLVPGLTFANELISRDENLHYEAGITQIHILGNVLDYNLVVDMIDSAVEKECDFMKACIPIDMIGLTSEMMCNYVKYIANRIFRDLGYVNYYNVVNECLWMEGISLQGKTNFFERRVSEYAKATANEKGNIKFTLDEDF